MESINMNAVINRRLLAVIFGGLVVIAGLLLASATSAGAARGGEFSGLAPFYIQGTVDAQDRPVFLNGNSGFEAEITQCLDSYCRNSTTSIVPTTVRGLGFTVVPDGRAVVLAVAEQENANGAFVSEDRLIVCSDTTCNNIISSTPAPARGSLHLRPNGSLIILGNGQGPNTITLCNTLDCQDAVSNFATGVPAARGFALDGFLPVFVTQDAILRCTQAACQSGFTMTPHGIDDFVSDLSLSANGLPQIYVERNTGDDAFYPELHHCLNAACSEIDIEPLNTLLGGRADVNAIGGNPTRFVVSGQVRPNELMVSTSLRCTASVAGNTITASFDGDANRANIIRLNGRFIETVTGQDTFTFTANNGDFFEGTPRDLILRNWTGNEFIDIPCLEAMVTPDLTPVCTVDFFPNNDADGVAAHVQWLNVDPSDIVVIRKNDRFLVSPEENVIARGQDVVIDDPERSIDDFGGRPGDTYTARLWSTSTTFTDINCTVNGNTATGPACTISAVGDDVRVNWTNTEDGIVVLRKDGRWLTTPAPGTTSFVDADADINSNYLLRFRTEEGPNFEDFTCTR